MLITLLTASFIKIKVWSTQFFQTPTKSKKQTIELNIFLLINVNNNKIQINVTVFRPKAISYI